MSLYARRGMTARSAGAGCPRSSSRTYAVLPTFGTRNSPRSCAPGLRAFSASAPPTGRPTQHNIDDQANHEQKTPGVISQLKCEASLAFAAMAIQRIAGAWHSPQPQPSELDISLCHNLCIHADCTAIRSVYTRQAKLLVDVPLTVGSPPAEENSAGTAILSFTINLPLGGLPGSSLWDKYSCSIFYHMLHKNSLHILSWDQNHCRLSKKKASCNFVRDDIHTSQGY